MSQVRLLHLGMGNVGQEVARQITSKPSGLRYCGVFTSKTGIFNADGIQTNELTSTINDHDNPTDAIGSIDLPFVLIDTTASDETKPLLQQALDRGGAVVLSNKKPLSGTQLSWDTLMKSGRVYSETTVGAGLPVISTIQSLLATGDKIERIQGCFSGTLGYLFSQLGGGTSFSQAVISAKEQGFTEPDPRDDLSGTDIARKALILSRLLGRKLALSDVQLTGLFPETMASLSHEDFMGQLPSLDAEYAKQVGEAKKRGNVLRYVATITPASATVGLQEVPVTSDTGSLQGPDNIVVIRTKRYHDNPLVIKGPGAGITVTAAGVFADVLRAAEALR
jgi:homoserine dehydrogenase